MQILEHEFRPRERLVHAGGNPTFGDLLVAFRKQHEVRFAKKVTSISVANKLGLTSASYSSLEASQVLPRNTTIKSFIATFANKLDLTTGEMHLLSLSYLLDYTARALDPNASTNPIYAQFADKVTAEVCARILQGERLPEVEEESLRAALKKDRRELQYIPFRRRGKVSDEE